MKSKGWRGKKEGRGFIKRGSKAQEGVGQRADIFTYLYMVRMVTSRIRQITSDALLMFLFRSASSHHAGCGSSYCIRWPQLLHHLQRQQGLDFLFRFSLVLQHRSS